MRYEGGKSRSASRIAAVITERAGDRALLASPFAGGLAVETRLAGTFGRMLLSDMSPDLMIMWGALYAGWDPPARLSEQEYRALRDQPPSPLRGFAGYGASFGGRWFEGYGRHTPAQAHRNGGALAVVEQSARTVVRDRDLLRRSAVTFRHCDYRDALGDGDLSSTVIYADPPYAGTRKYGAVGPFDSAAFWEQADRWHDAGAAVFVSETNAPAHWERVWTQEVAGSMNPVRRSRVESLYART